MKRYIAVLLWLLAAIGGDALGAGFDCKKATAPIETAICSNPELSLADDVMTESYQFLVLSCQALPGIDNLKAAQKKWLFDVRTQFNQASNAPDDLKRKYNERNTYLTQRLSQCSLLRNTFVPVAVKTLHHEKLSYTLPYIVASSPEIGRRINEAVFNRRLDMPAPGKFNDGLAMLEELSKTDGMRSIQSTDYSVIRNDGRLLVLAIEGEGCGAYCEFFTEQLLFDSRTGRSVQPEDLFTDAGTNMLAQRLKSEQIRRGKALVAKVKKKNSLNLDEEETYTRCLKDWSEYKPRLWPMEVDAKGRWRFVAGYCSAHVNRPSDLLDRLDEMVTMAQLEPHLNAYGRSLLMGDGDVLNPTPSSLQCEESGYPRLATNSAVNRNVVSVAAGNEHHLLVEKSGRLWAWGRNHNGEMGHIDTPSGSGDFLSPVIVGDDFVQVTAGMSQSAGTRRDGTLWTWGSIYLGALGNRDTTSQPRPVQIGKDFVSVDMNGNGALALQRNGTLWIWGYEELSLSERAKGLRQPYHRTLKQLAVDVTQMEFVDGIAMALKKDGSVWNWGAAVPRKVGDGFTKLAARNAKAAFKADGSLWAWDETLAALVDTQGRKDTEPAEVGQGFVKIKVASPNFVVALKTEGSLWATHARGNSVSIEPVACGFKDVVALGSADSSPPHDVVVMGLKNSGALVAWANWKSDTRWQTPRDLFKEPPITLGNGFIRLYQVDDGSFGARVVALKADGSVWQSPRLEVNQVALPKKMLEEVVIPKIGR